MYLKESVSFFDQFIDAAQIIPNVLYVFKALFPEFRGGSRADADDRLFLIHHDDVVKTFPEALRFILDEGPTQGVHILLQTDKPTNILFEDYPSETVAMFKHKVILRSENKYLTPMRFSVEIDVEVLSDEEERLRAFYYPEDGGPRLFTPYIIIKE